MIRERGRKIFRVAMGSLNQSPERLKPQMSHALYISFIDPIVSLSNLSLS